MDCSQNSRKRTPLRKEPGSLFRKRVKYTTGQLKMVQILSQPYGFLSMGFVNITSEGQDPSSESSELRNLTRTMSATYEASCKEVLPNPVKPIPENSQDEVLLQEHRFGIRLRIPLL